MPFPRIPALKDVVIPAREEQTFSDGFMTTLVIDAPSPNARWSATAEIKAFDYNTGNFLPDNSQVLQIFDLKHEVNRSPIVAAALGYVLTAVGLITAERKALAGVDLAQQSLSNKTNLLNMANDAVTAAQDNLAIINAMPETDPENPEYDKAAMVANAELVLQNAQDSVTAMTTAKADAQTVLDNAWAAVAAVRLQLGITE